MEITQAKYITDPEFPDEVSCIKATIDGVEMFIPINPANRHYAEILRQVASGTLTIADAD